MFELNEDLLRQLSDISKEVNLLSQQLEDRSQSQCFEGIWIHAELDGAPQLILMHPNSDPTAFDRALMEMYPAGREICRGKYAYRYLPIDKGGWSMVFIPGPNGITFEQEDIEGISLPVTFSKAGSTFDRDARDALVA